MKSKLQNLFANGPIADYVANGDNVRMSARCLVAAKSKENVTNSA